MSTANTKEATMDASPTFTLDELYAVHPRSYEFAERHRSIERKMLHDKKYDEIIIVTPSAVNEVMDSSSSSLIEFTKSMRDSGKKIAIVKEQSPTLKDKTFVEDRKFLAKSRREVEYNPNYMQLIVGAFITDGTDVLLLQTLPSTDGRIKDKMTLVQGHVTYTSDALIMNQKEFLKLSIQREIEEELNAPPELMRELVDSIPNTPTACIFDTDNLIGLEHFGYIYRIETTSDILYSLMSNEPESHNVTIIPDAIGHGKDVIAEQYDHWTTLVFENII